MLNPLELKRMIKSEQGGRWEGTEGPWGTVSTFCVPEQGQTLGKHWERLAELLR